MSNKKIKHSDLFDGDVWKLDDIEAYLNAVNDVKSGLKEIAKTNRGELSKINPKTLSDLDKLNKELAETAAIEKAIISVEKEREQLIREKLKTQTALSKEEERIAKVTAKANETLKQENREYAKLSKQLNENKKAVKDLLASNKALSETDKKLIADTQELDRRLKQIDKTVGDTQRSVGNYKDSVKAAINESGLLNGKLGQLVNTLKQVKENADKSGSGIKSIVTGGLLALAAAAAAALIELAKLNQSMVDSGNLALAWSKDIALAGTPFQDLERATQSFRIESRKLQLDLQQYSLDLEDQNEISNDATISLTERNIALEKSVKLSKQKAQSSRDIADGELALIDAEIKANEAVVSVGVGNATNELKNKRLAAIIKVNDAQDDQEDLERINAQKKRARVQSELINDIELTRSKKLSANAQVLALEKQFADEKVQLEERNVVAKKISDANTATLNEEFKIFQKGVNEKINFQELLAIQDAVLLKNTIRKNLASIEGTDLETELFKILKQGQDAEIERLANIEKLKDESIKRTQRMAQIRRDIEKAQLESQLHDAELLEDEKLLLIEKNNEEILKGENVFSRKLLLQRQRNQANLLAVVLTEKTKKEEILNQQAQNDKIAIENTISDEKTKALEIEKINKKLAIDLRSNENDEIIKKRELAAKQLQEDKVIAMKRREIAVDNVAFIGDAFNKGFDKQSQRLNDQLDKEISITDANISRQQELADKGLKNTLAFEEEKRAKTELLKEEQKDKDVKRAKVLAYFNAFTEYLKQDPDTASFKALAQVVSADIIVGAFKTGVEGLDGAGTETSDSNLALLSKGESVITASGTRENKGLATAMNNGSVDMWFRKNMLPTMDIEMRNNNGNFESIKELKAIKDQLFSLENTLKNKKESVTNWDGHGNMVVNEVEQGIKRTIQYVKKKPKI